METKVKEVKKYNYQIDEETGLNKTGRPRRWTDETLVKLGTDLLAWMDESEDNLFIGEFLQQQGLYNDLVCQYVDTSVEFSRIIKIAKEKQEWRLNKLAIKNINNPYYTKFFMMNHHGYSDKKETTISGNFALPAFNFISLNATQPPQPLISTVIQKTLPESLDSNKET